MSEADKPAGLTVRWLQPAEVQARWEAESVRLVVRIDSGEEVKDAHATLAFPITSPDGYVELSDSKGESLGVLKTLEGANPQTLSAVRSALTARYMIPHMIRLIELKEVSPFVLRWRVETDRGIGTFFTESPREAVRYLGHDRIRITDLAGNHFDIPSLANMDATSRGILSTFL